MPILNGKFSPSPCTSCTRALEEARDAVSLPADLQCFAQLPGSMLSRQEFGAWLKFLDHNAEGSLQATLFFFFNKSVYCKVSKCQVAITVDSAREIRLWVTLSDNLLCPFQFLNIQTLCGRQQYALLVSFVLENSIR